MTRLMGVFAHSALALAICASASSRSVATFIARTHESPIFSPPVYTARSSWRTMLRSANDITA